MSLYSLCNVSVFFFSFIIFVFWFRRQFYLAFVPHKRLCIKFEHYLDLRYKTRRRCQSYRFHHLGCVEGQSGQNPPVSYIYIFFATFLDPVLLNSEVAVARTFKSCFQRLELALAADHVWLVDSQQHQQHLKPLIFLFSLVYLYHSSFPCIYPLSTSFPFSLVYNPHCFRPTSLFELLLYLNFRIVLERLKQKGRI